MRFKRKIVNYFLILSSITLLFLTGCSNKEIEKDKTSEELVSLGLDEEIINLNIEKEKFSFLSAKYSYLTEVKEVFYLYKIIKSNDKISEEEKSDFLSKQTSSLKEYLSNRDNYIDDYLPEDLKKEMESVENFLDEINYKEDIEIYSNDSYIDEIINKIKDFEIRYDMLQFKLSYDKTKSELEKMDLSERDKEILLDYFSKVDYDRTGVKVLYNTLISYLQFSDFYSSDSNIEKLSASELSRLESYSLYQYYLVMLMDDYKDTRLSILEKYKNEKDSEAVNYLMNLEKSYDNYSNLIKTYGLDKEKLIKNQSSYITESQNLLNIYKEVNKFEINNQLVEAFSHINFNIEEELEEK